MQAEVAANDAVIDMGEKNRIRFLKIQPPPPPPPLPTLLRHNNFCSQPKCE